MSMPIQRFEHDCLYVGEAGFERRHWDALAAYNDRHGSRYFTLLRDGVRFNQHVGVVQAGALTIEILPKVQRLDAVERPDPRHWNNVLLHMLRECRLLQVHHPEMADLRLHSGSMLDAYFRIFLEELDRLLHEGLSRRYRQVEGNRATLKGSLLFSRHVRDNVVHAERFYVRHATYDREHLLHGILYKALRVVAGLPLGHAVKSLAGRLLLDFPEMPDLRADAATFARLKLSRKEERYREALLIARMILLQYRPDLAAGQEQVLALLFDMNKLWEEYVYRQLLRLEAAGDFRVSRQESESFWAFAAPGEQARTIRPDLVIQTGNRTIVVDTKWKLPDDKGPGDEDLRQMFAYAHYWHTDECALLYPAAEKATPGGRFVKQHRTREHYAGAHDLWCAVWKIPFLTGVDGEGIRLDFSLADLAARP